MQSPRECGGFCCAAVGADMRCGTAFAGSKVTPHIKIPAYTPAGMGSLDKFNIVSIDSSVIWATLLGASPYNNIFFAISNVVFLSRLSNQPFRSIAFMKISFTSSVNMFTASSNAVGFAWISLFRYVLLSIKGRIHPRGSPALKIAVFIRE